MMISRARLLGGALAVTVTLGACSPVVSFHGYAPLPEQIASITVGQDTRGSVRRKIGRPAASGIFTDDGWYYISTQMEQYAYYAAEIVDRRVVAITFDETDIVASVDEFGLEDGRIVNLETRTTPTFGRQLTILEQAFGNLGAIQAEDFLGGQ